jgi:predicted transcriptional regulator
MRVKKIRIKAKEEFFADLERAAAQIDAGKRPRRMRGEYFESLDAVRNVLTQKRLELWQIIRDQKPNSLLELSKIAGRDFKSVHRDVATLVTVGLIELRQGKGERGNIQRPVSLADTLLLEVA